MRHFIDDLVILLEGETSRSTQISPQKKPHTAKDTSQRLSGQNVKRKRVETEVTVPIVGGASKNRGWKRPRIKKKSSKPYIAIGVSTVVLFMILARSCGDEIVNQKNEDIRNMLKDSQEHSQDNAQKATDLIRNHTKSQGPFLLYTNDRTAVIRYIPQELTTIGKSRMEMLEQENSSEAVPQNLLNG